MGKPSKQVFYSRAQLLRELETLKRIQPKKPRQYGWFSPVGGTIIMRVGVEDAYAILDASRKRGVTCAEVIRDRNW